jgi:hypothetical protein
VTDRIRILTVYPPTVTVTGQKPKRRHRKPTLVSVARQAAKAGLDVARYEVDENGKIIIVPGTPDTATPGDANTINRNEWN